MMIEIRCLSCGRLIADKYTEFKERKENGEDQGKILDDLGVKHYCCRRMLLSHVDLIDRIMEFER